MSKTAGEPGEWKLLNVKSSPVFGLLSCVNHIVSLSSCVLPFSSVQGKVFSICPKATSLNYEWETRMVLVLLTYREV